MGRRVEVVCGLDTVTVSCAGHTVTLHPRTWAPHQTVSDLVYVAAAEEVRRARLRGVARPQQSEVEVRPLSVYDAAFGSGGGVA